MNKLSNYFVRGLITLVPIVITYYVIVTVFSFIEGAMDHYIPVKFPGMGIIILITIILLAGWFSVNCNWVTQFFLKNLDSLVDRIPIVKFIYNSVKRVSTMLFESKSMFSQVVLFPYPHPGLLSLGFLMTKPSTAITKHLQGDYETVFIPWSLNMSSGFNVFVPKKDLIYLDIAVEDAFQYILTAGGVMPGGAINEDMVKNLPTGLEPSRTMEQEQNPPQDETDITQEPQQVKSKVNNKKAKGKKAKTKHKMGKVK